MQQPTLPELSPVSPQSFIPAAEVSPVSAAECSRSTSPTSFQLECGEGNGTAVSRKRVHEQSRSRSPAKCRRVSISNCLFHKQSLRLMKKAWL